MFKENTDLGRDAIKENNFFVIYFYFPKLSKILISNRIGKSETFRFYSCGLRFISVLIKF